MMNDSVINPLLASSMKLPDMKPQGGGRVEPQAPQGGGKDLPANPAPEVSQQELSEMVESLNDYLRTAKRELRFSVDDNSGRTIITVMDPENDEVIRQIPPEAVLALAEYLRDEGSLGSFGLAEQA